MVVSQWGLGKRAIASGVKNQPSAGSLFAKWVANPSSVLAAGSEPEADRVK